MHSCHEPCLTSLDIDPSSAARLLTLLASRLASRLTSRRGAPRRSFLPPPSIPSSGSFSAPPSERSASFGADRERGPPAPSPSASASPPASFRPAERAASLAPSLASEPPHAHAAHSNGRAGPAHGPPGPALP
eukprot:tig00000042_g15571.t1